MKNIFYLSGNSAENTFFFNEDLNSEISKNQFRIEASQEHRIYDISNSRFLTFWKKLIFKPKSLPQKPNTSVYGILEEEKFKVATSVIKSILSKKLKLSLYSSEISLALDNSVKIFHEDHPWDFILEYDGERLGMILLDICYNSKNQPIPIYRYNPDIKSFRGIF